MDSHTLSRLQFDFVTSALAGQCSCALGRQLAGRIKPSRSPSEVRRWLDQTAEMMKLEAIAGLPPMGGLRDIRQAVTDSARPSGLTPETLGEVRESLAATGALCQWRDRLPADAPIIRAVAGRIVDLTALAQQIDQAIDPRCQIRDDASARLQNIRGRIDDLRRQIEIVFHRILKQPRYLKLLQYPNSTFHNDRVVLPLKAEQQGRIPGIIHRSSDSGATLFVEPAQVVELNNAIARLRDKEHEEITRILSELSRLVYRHGEQILQLMDAVAVLDLVAAKVRYARRCDAVCPQISDEGILDLRGARHPVLIEMCRESRRPVVPMDIRLGDDFDVLVITGPNTGGKTVALKTVGLLAAMAQAGVPIPVQPGSSLPIYREVFIDIGDEQSIEQSLSTFSAHLSNVRAILARAGKGTLVLIDELGAGTDPDEGSAIGWAVMDELLALGCQALLTTHLSQLKAAAYTTPRVDNAAVEFDVQTLQPTYVLRLGEPGNSNAIAIAERLGLPRKIVARAREHLDDQHRALARAIEGTLQSRRKTEEARKDAIQAHQAAQKAKEQYERKSRELDEQRETHARWFAWVNSLGPGDAVYVTTFGKRGSIVRMQLHKQSALVAIGAIDYEVELKAISRPSD